MIEDLTHEDYLKIARMVPQKYSFNELIQLGERVEVAFLLHKNDALAAVIIGSAINKGIAVLEYEEMKKQRIQEVVNLRKKD